MAQTARDRLLQALAGRPVDRPPVVCLGGMMTMATCSAMQACGAGLPTAHYDAQAMVRLVLATRQETGLESLAVPFCMTVEAEALGCRLDPGSTTILPRAVSEPVTEAGPGLSLGLPPFAASGSGRAPVVLAAIRRLAAAADGYPLVSAVVGPVSLAATVMECGRFLRLLRRQPEVADGLIAATTTVTLDFALAQRQAGADVVMIAEPTGTGEVLGGAHFSRFAAPALVRVLAALARQGVPTVLHICGDVRPILPQVRDLAAGLSRPLALSVDAMVSGVRLQRELPGVVRVGNVDAELLRRGPVARIETAARRAAAEFEVVTPACGLVPDTPAAHLQALVRSVQAHDPGTRTRPAAGTALTGVR